MLITVVGLDSLGQAVYSSLTQKCFKTGVTIGAYDTDLGIGTIESLLESDILMICDTRNLGEFCKSLVNHGFKGFVVIKGPIRIGTFGQLVKNRGNDLYLSFNPHVEDFHTQRDIIIANPLRFKQSHLNNLVNFYRIFYRGATIRIVEIFEAEQMQMNIPDL